MGATNLQTDLKAEPMLHLRRPDLKSPQWPPGADIAGKTVLLHCEGGFGDALQFVFFVAGEANERCAAGHAASSLRARLDR